MKKSTKFLIIASIGLLLFGGWTAVRIIKLINFNFECGTYIEQAANASTIESAKEHLLKAINYAEKENLTSGTVSIFLSNPKNDVSYWYNNMKSSYEELEKIPENSLQVDKTNELLKLHETLTNSKENSSSIILPSGISIYPYNILYFCWCMISIGISGIGGILYFQKK